jgi:outer membrane protein TolC
VTPIAADNLLEFVQRHNPELHGLMQEVQREQARIDSARLEGYPDFTVGVEYLETGDALMAGTRGSGDDPIAVNLRVNLPVFRGKYYAGVREAEAMHRSAVKGFRQRLFALASELELVRYRMEDAGRQISLYRDTLIPRAEQALRVTETAYSAGRASILDLIDSERALLAFEKAMWRASADYQQSRADLVALCGGELP